MTAVEENFVSHSLISLPNEVLELIWVDSNLNSKDICNLSKVCLKFRNISSGNEVWKCKFKQRWPNLVDEYRVTGHVQWVEEFKFRHRSGLSVQQVVASMSPKYFLKDDVSSDAFREFDDMCERNINSAACIIDELLAICNDGNPHLNLTNKYYTQKALHYMQSVVHRDKISQFKALPTDRQLIEEGAVYIAQWFQPSEGALLRKVRASLDGIAWIARSQLLETHPQHPITRLRELIRDVPSTSQWSSSECREVLDAIKATLYHKLGFRGNDDDYYSPENSYIDKVLQLRKGIPITLSIVFIAVARRLGVKCQPVNFPNHFLLKWKEHPHLKSVDEQYTYIDAFADGKFQTQAACRQMLGGLLANPTLSSAVFDAVEPFIVYERMVRNLLHIGRQQGQFGDGFAFLRMVTELGSVISPEDMDHRVMLARLYIHMGINLPQIPDLLEPVMSSTRVDLHGLVNYLRHTARAQAEEERNAAEPTINPKLRMVPDEVEYKVGTIMKHRRYDYLCVIFGWDSKCTATNEWIVQMGVHNLPKKHLQPFYNVLVEDGSNRYAAQENLEPSPNPDIVNHPEIGKHFSQFCTTYYKANDMKRQQYPDDTIED